MSNEKYPKVIFPEGFDEKAAFEMPFKGYSRAYVEFESGIRYHLYFCDPIRLQQDLADEVEIGKLYFAESGMVILPEVTVKSIEMVVQALWKEKFFDHLKPEKLF